ncbi:MAG: hypothetical protein SPJ34_08730 [Candidatus Ornithospirochaeta sp.]|nr:hypothetical protein [Candidatus Ornithospirochaeta sp.]
MDGFDYTEYENDIHRTGRMMCFMGLVLMFAIPFIFGSIMKAHVDWNGYLKGIARVIPIYLPSCIAEFLIYVPLLGAGGSYLAFITGNIVNMKLPCAFNAKEIAQTEAGTPENDIISTLSIATSSLVTMLVIFIGVLLLIPLTPILSNPVLQPAFDNVLPALFGALAAQYFIKSWKITAVPLIFMVLLCIIFPGAIKQTSMLMIPVGAIAIVMAWILYRKNRLN